MKKIVINKDAIVAVSEETNIYYFGFNIFDETAIFVSKKTSIEATGAILKLIRDEKAVTLLCSFLGQTHSESAELMNLSLRQYMRKREQYINQ